MSSPHVLLPALAADLSGFARAMDALAVSARDEGERLVFTGMAGEARTLRRDVQHEDPKRHEGAVLDSLDNLRSTLTTITNFTDPQVRTRSDHSSQSLAQLGGLEDRLRQAVRRARAALDL